jgi:hypothetical protein
MDPFKQEVPLSHKLQQPLDQRHDLAVFQDSDANSLPLLERK